MKRLILMGGRPWNAPDEGKGQADVMLRYFTSHVKIAFCIFAQPESDWDQTRQWNISMFDRFKGVRTLEYQTMTPENFAQVSAWADIVYMPGGEPPKLQAALEACGDVAALWDGKLIVGSSAGMDVLCAHYIYLHTKTLHDGFGWVNVSAIPHWRNEGEDEAAQSWAEAELLRQHPHVPVLCVPEGAWVEMAAA